MATDERLNAVNVQKGDAERSLQSIAETFRDVGESALEAASATEVVQNSFEDTQDSASGLTNALESVDSISSEVATGMTEVSGASEGAQEGLEDARNEAEGLNDQLSKMPATATAAAASLETLDGMNVGGFEDQSVGIDSQADMGAIERIRSTLSGVEDKSVQLDTETEGETFERQASISLGAIPDLRGRMGNISPTISPDLDSEAFESLPEFDVEIEGEETSETHPSLANSSG